MIPIPGAGERVVGGRGDDAIAELDTISEESYTTLIMQLLRDNLTVSNATHLGG